jgi:hypothetical protein
MPRISRKVTARNEMICKNLNDLIAAIRIIEGLPDDTEISFEIDAPAGPIVHQSKGTLKLFDQVPVTIVWETTIDVQD